MVAHKKQGVGNHERVAGILFTTSTPSKLQQCANVVLGLLDSVSMGGDEQVGSDSSTINVSEAIAQELAVLSRESKKFRFSGELSRGIGIITLAKGLVPSDIVHKLLSGSLPKQPPMFLSRVIPIDFVSAPNIHSFETVLLPLLKARFESFKDDVTWKIVLDTHGLSNITKDNLIALLLEGIPERHEVSIHNPEIVIMVQVTQKMCGIALLRDFDSLCEFNLRKLIVSRNSSEGSHRQC